MTNVSNALNQARTTGCYDGVYNASASGVNWIHGQAKTVAGSFSDAMKNTWTSVSDFASKVFSKLATFFAAAKTTVVDGLSKAKDAFVALPKEAKVVGAISLVATAVTTALICRCMNKPAAPAATAVAAAVAPAANGAPAAAAAAVQPPVAEPAAEPVADVAVNAQPVAEPAADVAVNAQPVAAVVVNAQPDAPAAQ